MNKTVTIIGGIAVDIEGFPHKPLIYQDSNPGSIHISFGGVGRNIAENLSRLGLRCHMVSAVGKDVFGENILRHLEEIGLSKDYMDIIESSDTAVYLSILNHHRDMEVAVNGMDIFNFWKGSQKIYESELIAESSLMVIDTNITEDLIKHLLTHFKDKKFLLDPVSVNKAIKVKDIIGRFHIIKPNRLEAEELSGIKINNEKDLHRAGDFFCDEGVEKIFITLGEEGVYYRDRWNQEGILRVRQVTPVSTTGSGDAFTAGIAYGFIHSFDMDKIARYGCACSYYALTSEKTVNDTLTEEKIKQYVEENF